jgi:predicted acylesterase/phospholipase RssA
VGAANRTDARRRLAALWNDLVLESPLCWPLQVTQDLSLYGLPHFYALRSDVLTFPSWTYLYDTHPLLSTPASHIDFAALNASDTAFVITAVDVESGVLKRFSNQKRGKTEYVTIEPLHVLASGSLPPQFPGRTSRTARRCGTIGTEASSTIPCSAMPLMRLAPTRTSGGCLSS